MNNGLWDRDEFLPPKLAEDLHSLRESIQTNELLRAKLRRQLLSDIASKVQDRPRPSGENRPGKTLWRWGTLAAVCVAAGLWLYQMIAEPVKTPVQQAEVVRQVSVLTLGPDAVPTSLAISNDSRWLAFEKNGSIWIRGLYGGYAQELLPPPTDGAFRTPAFSPDSSLVAVSMQQGDRSKIAVISIRTRKIEVLTSPPPGYADSQPAFSKDGASIAFIRSKWTETDRGTVVDGELWIMGADGSRAEKITDHAAEPAWSPDGKRLAFSRLKQGKDGNQREIWLVDKNGSGEKLLGAGEAPAWSPQGNSLAYIHSGFYTRSMRMGDVGTSQQKVEAWQREVWWMDAKGQRKTPLTKIPVPTATATENDLRPIWTTDPHNLYFVRLSQPAGSISLQRLELVYK